MSAGKNEVTHRAPASQPGPPTGQLTFPLVYGKQRRQLRCTCLRARPLSLNVAENEARMVEIGKLGTSSHITDNTRST